jgi:CheY-like chemotaxis protein
VKAVRVLVVEDNPLVMELLQKGLQPHCEVLSAGDGADALLKIIDDPPDLILCDFKMPAMDGRQLYEKLRGREATRSLPFIFMASRDDIEEKLRPLTDGVEDFISKPFFLRDVVRRAKKVVDRLQLEKMQQRTARPGVVQGRLEEMNMMDLLQSLEMGQKSCRLTVRRNTDTVEMFFTGGACKHASFGAIEGDEAVYKAVTWQDGEFEIDFNSNTDKVTTTRSTQGLLMEALRLIDEQNRDAMEAG